MKIAALDLGSNSFLCLICEGVASLSAARAAEAVSSAKEAGAITAEVGSNLKTTEAPQITRILHDQVKIVRLGQGLDKNKVFHPEALARAEQCLLEFKKEIDKHKPDRILAMATSAARDAKNGQELLDLGERVGIPIKIIPGHDEARITYSGAVSKVAVAGASKETGEKNILLIDIGGGSTEFILGCRDRILFSKSLDVGVVRFTERFVTQHPVAATERTNAETEIRKQIDSIKAEILKHRIDQVVAVAGTPTTLAAAELGGFDAQKIDGFEFSLEALKQWEEKLGAASSTERIEKYKIDSGRADVIYMGALILRLSTEMLGQQKLEVSTRGVRFGVALEMLAGRV